jgi:hypothetical protein
MIGHPSGDEPLMVDVRQSGSGSLNQYRRTASPNYDETLQDVIGRVATYGCLGKTDLGALFFWKRIPTGAWAEELLKMPDSEVREITSVTVIAARDQQLTVSQAARRARQALLDLPGARTGDPFASAVILAAAPDRMAVYDYRAHLGLWLVGLRLADGSGRYYRYMELIEQCRAELAAHGHGSWTAREVDLALFTIGQHRGPRPRPWTGDTR